MIGKRPECDCSNHLRVAISIAPSAFYTGVLGHGRCCCRDFSEGRFTLAFVGYGDETEKLRFWSSPSTGYASTPSVTLCHIAIGVKDITATCRPIATSGKVGCGQPPADEATAAL